MKIGLISCDNTTNTLTYSGKNYVCISNNEIDINLDTTIAVHEKGDTYTSNAEQKSLGLTVNNDNWVEMDELIPLNVSATESSYLNALDVNAYYVVENADVAEFTLVEKAPALTGVDESVTTKVYELSWSKVISNYAPDLYIDLDFETGVGFADNGSDFTVTDFIDSGTYSGYLKLNHDADIDGDTTEAIASRKMDITVNISHDSLIEYDEKISPEISIPTTSDFQSNLSIASFNINDFMIVNNDKFEITFKSKAGGTSSADDMTAFKMNLMYW